MVYRNYFECNSVSFGGEKLDNQTEYKLRKCQCGGEVELFPSKPWSQDPEIHCKKCGGTWRYGTYSDCLTIKEWNDRHGKQINQFSDLHLTEVRKDKYKRYKENE